MELEINKHSIISSQNIPAMYENQYDFSDTIENARIDTITMVYQYAIYNLGGVLFVLAILQ